MSRRVALALIFLSNILLLVGLITSTSVDFPFLLTLLFGGLHLFTHLYSMQVGIVFVSLFPFVMLVTFFSLGLIPAAWISFLSPWLYTLVSLQWGHLLGMEPEREGYWHRTALNAFMNTISILLGAFLFRAFGGHVPLGADAPILYLPILFLTFGYFATNHVIVGRFLYVTNKETYSIYQERLPKVLLYEVVPCFFAPSSALVFIELGTKHFFFLCLAVVGVTIFINSRERTQKSLNEYAQEIDSLQTVSRVLSTTLDLEEILFTIYQQVNALVPMTTFFIAFYDVEENEVLFPFVWEDGIRTEWPTRQGANGLTERVIQTRQPLLINQDLERVMAEEKIDVIGSITTSWLGVPILAGDELVGVIAVQSSNEHVVYHEKNLRLLEMVGAQAAVAIQNARLYHYTDTALHHRMQQLDSIFRTTIDGMLFLDKNLQVAATNPAFIKMTGLSLDQILHKGIFTWPYQKRILSAIGYTVEQIEKDMALLAKSDEAYVEQQVILSPNEATIYIDRILAPVYGESQSEIDGWLFIFRDVTEEVELESFKQSMTHMLVHDLRSPLTVIAGSLDASRHKLRHEKYEDVGELLGFAERGSTRLLDLIEDLLVIHRFEIGSVPLHPDLLPVQVLFNDAREQFQPLLEETSIELQVDVPDSLPHLQADYNHLGRVIHNLVDNAIKYTPNDGCIRLSAQVYTASTKPSLLLTVSDTGDGIPPEAQELLFMKFKKDVGEAQGRRHGSGLGLAYCKLVVEAHGGRIWVESVYEPGEGSHFKMILPIYEEN